MSGKRPIQSLISILGLVLFASFATTSTALAQPCHPEEASWDPSQSYTEGSVVFYNDQWFQARGLNNGKEPGITFEWKDLEEVPDCNQQTQSGGSTTGDPSPDSGSSLCVRPEHWRFSHDYSQGAMVTHGGKVWKAAGATSGDMPGMAEPPSWQLVPDHCSLILD